MKEKNPGAMKEDNFRDAVLILEGMYRAGMLTFKFKQRLKKDETKSAMREWG